MLTWLLPGLFSTSGRLAAILAREWHSQSIGDESSVCLIEDQSWIDCIDITSRWDTFVLFHLYGNKGVSLPLWPIWPRWFHTFCPCAEPLGDGHCKGMWARFGSQGSIALNWHSRYSGTRYSGTWLYLNSTYHTFMLLYWVKIWKKYSQVQWASELWASRSLQMVTHPASKSQWNPNSLAFGSKRQMFSIGPSFCHCPWLWYPEVWG